MKKLALTALLVLIESLSKLAFADAEGNARLFTASMQMCEATSMLTSEYAAWLGNLKKLVDADNEVHPENIKKNHQILVEKNEMSKDIYYEGLTKANNSLRGSSDIKGIVKSINSIVMKKAESLALSEPGKSRTYYQRSLDEFCSEAMLKIYAQPN